MKKFLINLFILTLILLVGCGVEGTPVKIELKGEAAVDLVVLVDEPNYAVNEIAKAFAAKLSEYTGKKVELGELSEFDGGENVYPIYIDTVKVDGSNLPDFNDHMSVAETDMITWVDSAIATYDKDCEIIYGKDSAQVIAPNEYMLYFALEEVLNGFKNENHFVLAGTRTLFGGDAIPTPAQLIEKVGDVQFLFTEYKMTWTSDQYYMKDFGTAMLPDDGLRMQGGGTDGTHAYYAIYENTRAYIYKIDLETWKVIKVSEFIPTGHSNDITYIPDKDLLLVVGCTGEDNWSGYSYVKADTLEFISNEDMHFNIGAAEYLPETQQFVFEGDYIHYVCDKDFNILHSFECGFHRDTTQGFFCDGSYIYDSRWGEKDAEGWSGQNHLIIHDMEGNLISLGSIYGDPYGWGRENENVFIYNNLFYIGYYDCSVNENVMVPTNMFE